MRSSTRLAAIAGISPLVVGLTVVALGTSAPELAVNLAAAWRGDPAIGFGNVVGSNIFNLLVVLGLSALVVPIVVARELVRIDLPIMLGASMLLGLLALDGRIGRAEGLVLAAALGGYIVYTIRRGRRVGAKESRSDGEPSQQRGWSARGVARQGLLLVAGVVALVVGSRWFVAGAADIARALGVEELVVGLTIVAAGTSAPEVVTSVVAALRGERDIAVGNVVGSNLFNILAVLGLSAAVAPSAIPIPAAAMAFDIPLMILVSLLVVPIMVTGYRVSRAEGALLLGGYLAYLTFLVLGAAGQHSVEAFGRGLLAAFLVATIALSLGALRDGGLRGRRWQLKRREAGAT